MSSLTLCLTGFLQLSSQQPSQPIQALRIPLALLHNLKSLSHLKTSYIEIDLSISSSVYLLISFYRIGTRFLFLNFSYYNVRLGPGGGGKHSSTEQVIWQKSLQAWIGFLENMKVCENKSSTFKPVLDLYKKMRTKKKKNMRTGVPSVGQVMCTHPCYIIPACLRCLCLENSISTSNTVKLIFK